MTTKARCPSDDCPTLGVDARSLQRYADLSTDNGEWLVYDRGAESAWIQSDVYYSRETCI